jgi:DNA-binding MarR family transcriptional regulator
MAAIASDPSIADSLDRIIVAGVAITTVAISRAGPVLELTFPQWRVVLVLGETPEGMRIGEVSQRIGVTLPATSRQLRRLARRGLVTISPDPLDRRAARAALTDAGRAARTATLEYRRRWIESVAETFESDDVLRARLDEIAEAVSREG